MSDSWESTNSVTDARSDSEGWTEVTVRPVHAEKTSFVGKHVLQGLIPQTRYIARVSSKNDYGYNKPKTFEFGTKGAGETREEFTKLAVFKKAMNVSMMFLYKFDAGFSGERNEVRHLGEKSVFSSPLLLLPFYIHLPLRFC